MITEISQCVLDTSVNNGSKCQSIEVRRFGAQSFLSWQPLLQSYIRNQFKRNQLHLIKSALFWVLKSSLDVLIKLNNTQRALFLIFLINGLKPITLSELMEWNHPDKFPIQ